MTTLLNKILPVGYPFTTNVFLTKDESIVAAIEFVSGHKDDWKWQMTIIKGANKLTSEMLKKITAEFDRDYFQHLLDINAEWSDIEEILNACPTINKDMKPEQIVLDTIYKIADRGSEENYTLTVATHLRWYMGIISEERYPPTKVGLLIKLVGMYQVLVEDWRPDQAAVFTYDRNWRYSGEHDDGHRWRSKINKTIIHTDGNRQYTVIQQLAKEQGLDKWRK
jgi:hypothetical protein